MYRVSGNIRREKTEQNIEDGNYHLTSLWKLCNISGVKVFHLTLEEVPWWKKRQE